ncbi:MAG TPA: hypothetical protein PLN21_11685 [Gemmatales bacterium]|nr:hypothetical protein [Gemmatales bacterium]
MRAASLWTLLLSVIILSLAHADDEDKDKTKNEKKAKIPPLTVIGYYDGEIVNADGNSDRLALRTREITQKWVPNNQGGAGYNPVSRRLNGAQGGSYVPTEQAKDIEINLSPDVKVRIMYSKPAAPAPGGKKEKPLTEKEKAEKDPDYKLGGTPGKKSQLGKGQIVRITMGRNNDRINPQNYGMVVYVVTEGSKEGPR